jgi:hypothetical protein
MLDGGDRGPCAQRSLEGTARQCSAAPDLQVLVQPAEVLCKSLVADGLDRLGCQLQLILIVRSLLERTILA